MKKQFLLGLIFVLFCGIISGQHLKRVNNNPGADPDYATLQAANDAASNGDTVYVEGSATEYDGAEISKRLIIIGPGYFLTDNDSTQAFGIGATFSGSIKFNAGSAGSLITGCTIHNSNIILNTNDISVIRCNVSNIGQEVSEVNNILLLQNYINYIGLSTYRITNSIISNNIVTYGIFCSSSSGPLQIVNNVVSGGSTSYVISADNASIANNIITQTNVGIAINTGNAINNNILAGPGTNAHGNQYNVAMANVFVDFSGSLNYSDDAKWKLKTGSPAIGAGVSGVDCGAFGGPTPYVLSGVPNLPHIYEATIPGTAYSNLGLTCTVKIKSGK
jgi:hypothetical protein